MSTLYAIALHVRTLLITSLLLSGITSQAAPQLVEVPDFGANPGNLRMFVHSPATFSESILRAPLVIALHGCSQSAERLVVSSGWNKLADERGFHVIYPQQRTFNNATGCFNWFRRDDITDGGEAASILQMIQHAIATLPIDSDRVFIYGVSAGGAMAVNLMACHPSLFNAGAVIAGGPFLGNAGPMEAMRSMIEPADETPEERAATVRAMHPGYTGVYPRLLVIHGQEDRVAHPRNSIELIEQWADLHGIDPMVRDVGTGLPSIPGLERWIYRDGNGLELLVLYQFSGLGHAIPIDPGEGPCQGGQVRRYAIDLDLHSTCTIADFFRL